MTSLVRFFYSICGLLALALGLVMLWLNVNGGFGRAIWLCEAGFCEAEVVDRSLRASAIATPVGLDRQAAALERIVLRNDSASPFAWSDAAFAYQKSGDRAKARYCAARALALGSGSAPLLMRVLHFHLGENSREDVLKTGKILLALVRDYDDFVFRYYDAVEATGTDVLARGLPPVAGAAASYLYNRMGAGDAAAAGETWGWMRSHSLVTEPALNAYVGFLMRNRAVEKSRQTWDEFHAAKRTAHPGNLVFNPDCEFPLSKGPYDWRMDEAAGVSAAVDRTAREGRPALRIEFRGEANVEFHHVGQTIPVTRRPLVLKAWVKCDGLTTNEGVTIRVYDREVPARFNFTTEPLTGTADWKQWAYPLNVPPQTELLELRVVRQRSQKFDNKIKGTAWLSGISLEPAAAR